MTAPTLTPSERLMAELRHERRVLRVNVALTGLTLIGLVVGIVAVARAGDGATGTAGFLESFVGVGGRAGLVAAIGYAVAYLAGGLPAFWSALKALFLRGKLAIDMLMVLAAIAAALVGEVRDGAILLFLFSLAETLEDYAMGNTKRAVASLMQLKPETATLMQNGDHRVVPVDDVDIGARILVRPGERIPLDGTMVAGTSAVDQAPITGESVPVDKAVGDMVFAGTVNGYGAIEVEVTKDASHSTLARMIDLVTIAQSQRSPSQRFSEWFGQRYTRFVLLGAAVALGAFLLFGLPRAEAFYRAATLLVVASPCAIVISVPAAVLSALARAARIGVLFKGGAALEDLGSLDIVAFDKTGTLTEGKMRLTDVVPLATAEAEVLRLAAAIESTSEHPVAKAIVAAANGDDGEYDVSDVQAVPGKGVRAVVDGVPHWAGTRKLAAEQGVEVTPEAEAALSRLEAEGRTAVLVGNQGIVGVVGVADTLRPTAAATIAALRDGGVRKIVMLTGDHPQVARAIGGQLGIADDDIYSELLPEEKLEIVNELRKGGTVAFVGDGVNDAAALATADVGVAMGAAGTDVALEAAEVALLSDDLRKFPQAHHLARRANRVIRQNLTFALGIMIVMVVITLAGRLPLPLGVLGHEGGTILVVMNGLRLLAHRPREVAPVGITAPSRTPEVAQQA
ncbi:MAG: heavy metal translocating P-type ATPase [Trueperaceae bacterium]